MIAIEKQGAGAVLAASAATFVLASTVDVDRVLLTGAGALVATLLSIRPKGRTLRWAVGAAFAGLAALGTSAFIRFAAGAAWDSVRAAFDGPLLSSVLVLAFGLTSLFDVGSAEATRSASSAR